MVAISIISKCNNNCKYCFQQDSYHKRNLIMSYEDFEDILVWSKGSPRVSILGGEPTLHPDIVKMAKRTAEEFSTIMLTNLLGKTKVYEDLIKVANNCSWLVNTTTRDDMKPLFEENIKLFQKNGIKFTAGITLMHEEEYDNAYIENLIDLGRRYPDVILNYRIGLATPYHRGKFELLNYDEILLNLCKIVRRETPDIPVDFDCPTNMCQISAKVMGELMDEYDVFGLKMINKCAPIIDISADKSVKFCASVPDDLLITKTYKMFSNWRECEEYFFNYMMNYLRSFNSICCNRKNCTIEMCKRTCLATTAYLRKQEMEETI